MTDKVVVFTTCGSPTEAERLAHHLIEQRLAACVNILPAVRSVYRWQGKIEDSEETLLIIKSRRELFERLRQTVERQHSYEVPEVLALPVVDGAPPYLSWLDAELA